MTRIRWFIPLALMAWLSACAGTNTFNYNGRTAKPDGRIAIEAGGPYEETWENNDLSISYAYNREADGFDVNGRVKLQKRLASFPSVEFLRLNVHFLNSEGTILASHRLWTALGEGGLGGKDYFIHWQFDRRFTIPEATRTMTFSYNGRMRDRSGSDDSKFGGGDSFDFWRTP